MQKKLLYFYWLKITGYNATSQHYDYNTTWYNGSVYTKQKLELLNVSPSDEGQYACVVSDKVTQEYMVFNITVREPQQVRKFPSCTYELHDNSRL